MTRTIVVAGAMAQRVGHGGHAWVFAQYLLGFRRLGYDVLFLDALATEMCVDRSGALCPLRNSANAKYLQEVMAGFGLGDSFSLDCRHGEQTIGLPRSEVLRRVRGAAIVNVMGYLKDEEILEQCGLRVFLDIDPGFGQLWQAEGLCHMFTAHDRYVTIGLNIGGPDCDIPTCGIDWITTSQPVVLEHWPQQQPGSHTRGFTSVASWRGPFAPIEHNGRQYGLRVHEFRKFLELPIVSGREFELALDIDPAETRDLARLTACGWRLIEPASIAGDPRRYRRFIQDSFAEFMVAKGLYVGTHSGWLSDRSLCYLASGRPVLAQDTGLRRILPSDEGLLLYTTLDEALARVEEVVANPQRQAQAARRLAEERFDSDKVLGQLLAKLGVDLP